MTEKQAITFAPRDLGDGLTLRLAEPKDYQNLVDFNRSFHLEQAAIEVEYFLAGRHPEAWAFLIVVDTDERIVCTVGYLEVRWRIGQTEILIGQPEFVATLPEYRNRGLVRLQFDVIHEWMTERGISIGLIGGIYYYYRLFGYEYGVEMARAGMLTVAQHAALVNVPDGVTVRPAVVEDIPALLKLSDEADDRFDISSFIPASSWEWLLTHSSLEKSEVEAWAAEQDGQIIGSARIYGKPDNRVLYNFTGNETATLALIKAALSLPGADKLRIGGTRESWVGQTIAPLQPQTQRSYAWYIRIHNVQRAFEDLRPEFERRIAASSLSGLTRELEIDFFRGRIKLHFQNGAITEIVYDPKASGSQPKIGMPPDVLPKVLMGYRSLAHLKTVWVDLYNPPEDDELLNVLFPPLSNNTRLFL